MQLRLRHLILAASLTFISVLSTAYAGKPLDPKAVEWIMEGNRYCEQAEYGKAVAAYEQALKYFDAPDAAYNLGVTYEVNLHDPEKAKYYYQRFINLEPDGPDAEQARQWLKDLDIAYPVTQTPAAKAARPRRLEDLPDSSRDRVINALKQGQLLFLQHKYRDAAYQYESVLELYESPDAYFNLGMIYGLKLGEKAKALPYLEKFVLMEPKSVDAVQARKWVEQLKQDVNGKK